MPPETILPCYIACDESLSMADHAAAVSSAVSAFLSDLVATAGASTGLHLGIVGFSESAELVRPIGPLGAFDLPVVPRHVTAISSFRRVFRFLLATVDTDVAGLLARPVVVRRPVVLFVSDGQATDPATWPAAHAELVDPARPAHPHLLAIGVGDADTLTLSRIATLPSEHGVAALDRFTCSTCCSPLVPPARAALHF
jgi:uncharacterized protein YegL